MISEINFDFRKRLFQLHGYHEVHRFDRNGKYDGMLLFVWKELPPILIESPISIEGFFIELNLTREKWFICSFYNPKCSLISYHLSKTDKHLGILTSKNDNIILMGDFNAESNTTLLNFYGIYNLKN